jgi:hypothetical protein
MKIYTVSHAEQSPLDHGVDAAFPTRKAAVAYALRLMLERLDRCDAFRSALMMVPEIRMKTGNNPKNLRRDSVLEWIQFMLDSVGRVDVKDSSTGRRFSYSVTETNLTGPMWVTITKGDGDTEDLETALRSQGGYTADLPDGRSVSVVLYKTDFGNVR